MQHNCRSVPELSALALSLHPPLCSPPGSQLLDCLAPMVAERSARFRRPCPLRFTNVASTSCMARARCRECTRSRRSCHAPAHSHIDGGVWLDCVLTADGDLQLARVHLPRPDPSVGHRGGHIGSRRGELGSWLPGRPASQIATAACRPPEVVPSHVGNRCRSRCTECLPALKCRYPSPKSRAS